MSTRRVVVTGIGWVTALGVTLDQVWNDLLEARSGIRSISRFDASKYSTRFGGEVLGWEGGPHIDRREAKRLDRFAQFALNAAIDAARDSGIQFEQEDPWRCGSIVGTGIGGLEEFEASYNKLLEKGPDRVSPFTVPKLMCNAASGNVSIYFHIRGPNSATASACASAAHAIGEASKCIKYDEADVMIAGGTEAALTPLGLACFTALRALSERNDSPATASRPFDKTRDGFVMSEGSGILVLEEYEHARRRGARIYCELLGYGQSADGSHITAPDEEGRGAAYAMEAALRSAKANPADVCYVNAHGTSTPLGDVAETRAIKRLFGDHARKLMISSTKSMVGHSLGASGGIEAGVVAKTIHTGMIHPTANYSEPDPDCDLDYVPNTARDLSAKGGVPLAISNSFGFGGHNVCLVMGKL